MLLLQFSLMISKMHLFQAFTLIMFVYILFTLKDVPLNIRVIKVYQISTSPHVSYLKYSLMSSKLQNFIWTGKLNFGGRGRGAKVTLASRALPLFVISSVTGNRTFTRRYRYNR